MAFNSKSEANEPKNRPSRENKRIPVSGRRDIMTVNGKDDGFEYRWVNDSDDRISRFQRGGWEFAPDEVVVGQRTADTSTDSSSITSKSVGKGTTAYLMRIKKEWYEEDQTAKAKQINEYEEDLKRTLNSGKDGTYGKVEIK